LQALLRHGLRSSNPVIQKGINWILAQQKADGQFKSVWFEGGIYGTAQTMELLSMFRFKWNILRLSRQIYQSRQRALNYILSQRNSSGDWGTSVTETALAVSALKLEANHLDKHIFDGAVQSILARQNPQGSFEPVYRGIYAKGWNYEEPIATALTAIQALQRYLIIKR
jgi:squalene cyclase